MDANRRAFLKGVAGAGAAGLAAALPAALPVALAPGPARAAEPRRAPADAVGMLYDTTRCIGCQACVVACREANGLPPDTRRDPRYDMAAGLNDRTKNVIKVCRDGDRTSFVKQQCMHCLDPSCAAACMIGALQKRDHGIVTWEASRCIGCRYCQVACPYGVPRFEWDKAAPRIVKCELCAHRIAAGGIPACCEVCPREAVVYGTYEELLAAAHARLAASPGRYVDRVYGEFDGGGTQVLYLSHVPFESIGLPDLGRESAASGPRTIQHGVYQGFLTPAVIYAVLGGVIWRNRRQQRKEGSDE